jgi:hypothetical protein
VCCCWRLTAPTFANARIFFSQPGMLRIHFHSSTIDVNTADSIFILFQYHSFSSIVTAQEIRIPAAPVFHLSKLNGPDDQGSMLDSCETGALRQGCEVLISRLKGGQMISIVSRSMALIVTILSNLCCVSNASCCLDLFCPLQSWLPFGWVSLVLCTVSSTI